MANKPEYYQQKYVEVLEREEKLIAFVEAVARGDYRKHHNLIALERNAKDALNSIKK